MPDFSPAPRATATVAPSLMSLPDGFGRDRHTGFVGIDFDGNRYTHGPLFPRTSFAEILGQKFLLGDCLSGCASCKASLTDMDITLLAAAALGGFIYGILAGAGRAQPCLGSARIAGNAARAPVRPAPGGGIWWATPARRGLERACHHRDRSADKTIGSARVRRARAGQSGLYLFWLGVRAVRASASRPETSGHPGARARSRMGWSSA